MTKAGLDITHVNGRWKFRSTLANPDVESARPRVSRGTREERPARMRVLLVPRQTS
jgi:hypothetical protein